MEKLNWFAPCNDQLGYGQFGVEMARQIVREGVKLHYDPTEGNVMEEFAKRYEIVEALTTNPFEADASTVMLGIAPHFCRAFSRKKMIGYTLLENDRIPQSWVHHCNQMDAVFTMSKWGVDVFRKSGVTVPMSVVPGGVDPAIFHSLTRRLDSSVFGKYKDAFKFVAMGKWENRKGYDVLVRAFSKAFGKRDDVVLFLVADNPFTQMTPERIMAMIGEMRLPERPPIIPIPRAQPGRPPMSREDVAALLASCDAFCLPTRGEGFGLPWIEAMAVGLPTIGTNYSALTEFMNEKNSLLVPVKGMTDSWNEVCNFTLAGGKWAEPDEEKCAELMRWVFDNQKAAKEIGKVAARDVADNWTWKKMAKKLVKEVEVVEDGRC